MRHVRGLSQGMRRLVLLAFLLPAAFGLAFIVLELGSIATAGVA